MLDGNDFKMSSNRVWPRQKREGERGRERGGRERGRGEGEGERRARARGREREEVGGRNWILNFNS